MKTLKLLLAGLLINLVWFFYAHAISSNEVKVSEPLGGDVLPGKSLFRDDVPKGFKDSFLFSKVIPFAIEYGIRLAIGLSVVVLIFGGFQYIAAFGKKETTEAAQKTITYALIGLVIALTAFGIVSILTSIKII